MMSRSYIAGLTLGLLTSAVWAQAPAAPSAPATPASMPEINLPAAMAAPMPAEAKSMQPAISQPIQEAVPAATALPAIPTDGAVQTAPKTARFSFGDAPNSLLFTPAQVSAMKQALSAFESIRHDSVDSELTVTEALPIEPEKIVEPATYPVYHLSSIVYRANNDWAVWVNGTRITPRLNDGEVKVTSVRADRAWFSWQPTYVPAVAERLAKERFADTASVKHRFTSENASPNLDRQTGIVHFSLKPNQSFAAGYFRTFEGRIASPAMEPLQPVAAAGNGDTLSPQDAEAINGLLGDGAATAPVASDRAMMDTLIENQQRMVPQPPAQKPIPTTP